MAIKYKQLKETKNLFYLWVEGLLKNAILTMENGKEKTIEQVLDYDSITHTFRIKFTDNDILILPDKDRYAVKVPTTVDDIIIYKPTHKRKPFKRKLWK